MILSSSISINSTFFPRQISANYHYPVHRPRRIATVDKELVEYGISTTATAILL